MQRFFCMHVYKQNKYTLPFPVKKLSFFKGRKLLQGAPLNHYTSSTQSTDVDGKHFNLKKQTLKYRRHDWDA